MNNEYLESIYFGNHVYKFKSLLNYLDLANQQRYFDGEVIEIENDEFIYYIKQVKQGKFKICLNQYDGITYDFAYCFEGTIIQVNQVVNHLEVLNPASLVALENAIVYKFSMNDFYDLIKKIRMCLRII